jgi:hypothetical protein
MKLLATQHGTQAHIANAEGMPLCGRRMTVVDRVPNPEAPVCQWCSRLERFRATIAVQPQRLDLAKLAREVDDHGGADSVGAKAGVAGRAIRYWIQRKTEPGILSLARVCQAVGIPLESLLIDG